MSIFIENKILKNSEINKGLILKVTQNEMAVRILVEFKNEDGKLVIQKSFQNTVEGRIEAQKFEKKIKSLKDLKIYLGLIKKEKRNVTNKDS